MNSFRISLKEAEQKLAACEQKIEKLEKDRAMLRHMIAVLRTSLGIEPKDNPSLTDAILLAVKSSREMECLTAAQVVQILQNMNIDAKPRSVATILSRLFKEGRLNSYLDKPFGSVAGYEWKGARTKDETLAAKRALAQIGKQGAGR